MPAKGLLENQDSQSDKQNSLKSTKPKGAKKMIVTRSSKSVKVRTVSPSLNESNALQTSSDVNKSPTSAGSYTAIPSTSTSKTHENNLTRSSKRVKLKACGKKMNNGAGKVRRLSNDAAFLAEPDSLYDISSSDDDSNSPVRDRGTPYFTPKHPHKYRRPNLDRCKFYHNRLRKDGTWVFNKKLLAYFMKPDSPDYHDLKNKRFNTSFLHEKRRGPRDIQIYTPEELKTGPVVPFPEIKVNVTDGAPGEKYANVFKNIPLSPVELDDDIKKIKAEYKKLRRERRLLKKTTGKAIKTPHFGRASFDGKPFPDEALGPIDYEKLFGSTKMFAHESVMDIETLLSSFNTSSTSKSVVSQETESEDSYCITDSQKKKLENDPRKYDWVNELSDKGRLLSAKEMVANQRELKCCSGNKKSKSAAGCNENKKSKAKAKCTEKKSKSAGFNEKRKPKSTGECNEKRKPKSTVVCNEKKSKSKAEYKETSAMKRLRQKHHLTIEK